MNVTVTSVLFQPCVFAAGDRDPLIVGAVASRLMVTEAESVPPPLVAVQVSVVPGVSLETVVGSQPDEDVIGDSPSTTDHDTVTSLVYQPLLPSVPTTVGVMTGGVESDGGAAAT